MNGQITASGGLANIGSSFGGGIRLIAQDLNGGGVFTVGNGGRLRFEANTQHLTNPSFADTFPVSPGATPIIWPAADASKAIIISVAGQSITNPPLAALNGPTDLTIATNTPVNVLIQTQNFPLQGTVSLRVIPKYSSAFWVNATNVSGSFAQATWRAWATFPTAYSTMIVRAAAP